MNKILKFNESQNNIDWETIRSEWYEWYLESNGESDYEDEYDALKSFVKVDIDWKQIQKEYYKYIEMTSNEDDYDDKFINFKKIVIKYGKLETTRN
jgi:hypothetical protein